MLELYVRPVVRVVEAAGAPAPVGGHVAGMAVQGQSSDVDEQLRQVWANLHAVLHGAGATFSDLVQARTYLADRAHREANSRVRREVLAGHEPALTVVVRGLYEESWFTEIKAVAVLPARWRGWRGGWRATPHGASAACPRPCPSH